MEFIYAHGLNYVFRMFIACICGAILGYERKSRGKSAGIRTHLVVAIASALMMILSKYAYNDMTGVGVDYKLDPSRVAAGIVSGVGFLGAGMIYIHGKTPHGLTTAAGIWATSGIGMAIGGGMYLIGLCATALIFFAQLILHRNLKLLKVSRDESMTLVVNGSIQAVEQLRYILEKNDIQIDALTIKRLDNEKSKIVVDYSTTQNLNADDIISFIDGSEYIQEIHINGELTSKNLNIK